jgi:toxin ParE1/3/4
MQNNNFRLSALAKNDLLSIFSFTLQNWGEDQARVYAKKLSNCFEMLAQSPNIGTKRNNLFNQALSFSMGSHIIFYRENKPLKTQIEIARVLHQSMDFEKHFN